MKRSFAVSILLFGTLYLAGCGGGGGSAVPAPNPVTPTTMRGGYVDPQTVRTDGTWVVWDGREGISSWFNDGATTQNAASLGGFTGRIQQYYVFDGRYLVFSAEMGSTGDADLRLFYYDTQDSLPVAVKVTGG